MATNSTFPVEAAASERRGVPRRFGRYALFDFIGKGGMAEIFLARAKTELGGARLCIVKQIITTFADDAQFAGMLTHEAKLAARLNHTNIVQVFDLGRADGQLYIAMEYVEGFDLNALLRQCSKAKIALPIEFTLRIVADALKGLDYAHRRTDEDGKPLGIVHRDVSPSNILISFEGEVKLCDFGIAHANDLVAAPDSHIDDAVKGKAGYMSPEHARGEALDARADVFAAGIVLWELLAGRRMYKTDEAKPTLLEQAKQAEIPEVPIRSLPFEERLHALVQKALAANRSDRFASAGAMLRELEEYTRDAKLTSSPLRFGEWLVQSFGTDIVTQRRARERAADSLERDPAMLATPLPIVVPPPLPTATTRLSHRVVMVLAAAVCFVVIVLMLQR
jgi:eukaryotic-like serine/threonine-protein kinase